MSKRVYRAAFHAITGRAPAVEPSTVGRTDRAVMGALFAAHRLPLPAWPLVEAALGRAGFEHTAILRAEGVVLPGAREVLTEVAARGTAQSVLTGNVRANAQLKLSTFDLNAMLDLEIGAFGGDGENRAELVLVAVARFTRHAGAGPSGVVLVGDTPRDVRAAADAGVNVVAVATGIHRVEELRAAGAPVVLDDLVDLEQVLRALGFTS